MRTGIVLISTGSGIDYQFVAATSVSYTPAVPSNWVNPPPTTVQQALDRMAAVLFTHFGAIP